MTTPRPASPTPAAPARYGADPGPAVMAAARALFESAPLATVESVAAEVGVNPYWTRRWKREGSWAKATRAIPALSTRATQLADTFTRKMQDLGKPLDDTVAASEAAREASTEYAVDVRAGVLDRHRKEWSAPRKIAYEAIQKGDFERAKLAKISAETLTLIQAGECRAFGINHDARAADDRPLVVLERGAVQAVPAAPAADADDEGGF